MRASVGLGLCLLTLGVLGEASAAPFPLTRLDRLPIGTAMAEGAPALAPLPFLRFCQKNPAECGGRFAEGYVALDAETWARLREVNVGVNRSIAPKEDGFDDIWELGKSEGDCDDYAVEKRHRLIELGMSPGVLALTEVITRGVGHLVLAVRTDRGALILDNLRDAVLPWRATGYQFVKMQSTSRPDYWVAVNGSAPAPVVSAVGKPPSPAAINPYPAPAIKPAPLEAMWRDQTGRTVSAGDTVWPVANWFVSGLSMMDERPTPAVWPNI